MTRENRRKIEWAFYNYNSLKQIASEYITEITESGLVAKLNRIGSAGGSFYSPTEERAIKLTEGGEYYLWAKVVENTLIALRWKYEEDVVRRKYFDGQNVAGTCFDLHIGRSTYFFWIDNALSLAQQWAYELGLIG